MCFHGNQLSWGIKHPLISLWFKYCSPGFIHLSTVLAPVISSLDEIYCIWNLLHRHQDPGSLHYTNNIYKHENYTWGDWRLTGRRTLILGVAWGFWSVHFVLWVWKEIIGYVTVTNCVSRILTFKNHTRRGFLKNLCWLQYDGAKTT